MSDSPFESERAGSPRLRLRERVRALIKTAHRLLDFPFAVLYLLGDRGIHPAYRMGWRRRLRLALRMYRNTRQVASLTSYKAHLAMTVKLLEIPPEVEGVVVECGCYLGGSTANLSLACEITGRDLVVYDSFEGLPSPDPQDRYGNPYTEGFLKADLEQVKENVRRLGAIERCSFVKGFFADTLPQHDQAIVLCFLDVDLQGSLHDCVINLWPHLTEKGYVFIDEYVFPDYCALFYSERYWREHFDTVPPGLVGAGSGVGVGEYYLGPWDETMEAPLQDPASVAYTRKDFSGYWDFYPDTDQTQGRAAQR
jgi:O-methyltransferase